MTDDAVVAVLPRTSLLSAYQARRTDARLRAAEKAKWKAIHRFQRERRGRP